MLACRSVVLSLHCISLLSHASHCFRTDGIRCGKSLHTHACFPIFWNLHSLLSVAHQWDWVALARTLPCPASNSHFWEWRLFLPLGNCANMAQHWPPGFLCAILGGSALLAPEIVQCSLWVFMSLLNETVHCSVSVLSKPRWIVHCAVLVASQPPDSPHCSLRSFGSQSLSLRVKIAQSS